MLKKFVALTEDRAENPEALGVVTLGDSGELHASIKPPEEAGIAAPRMIAAAADEALLIMTSEYRFMLKTTQQIATLDTLGLRIAEAESFHADEFGAEYVSGIAQWRSLRADAPAVLISTSGHFKTFKGEALISRVETPVGYQPQRIKGYPFTVVGAGTQVIVFNTTGRAVRLPMGCWKKRTKAD